MVTDLKNTILACHIDSRLTAPAELSSYQQLQESLRESEERFRGMFEEAPVACHEIDRDGIVLRVNQAECTLLGFEAHEMKGRSVWDFMAPEEREKSQEVVRKKMAGESAFIATEREYLRQDGSTVVLEIHARPILDAAGGIVGIRSFLLDVTAAKRAQQALQKQAEALVRSNAELEQFAYVASHDLQEPLRKILAFSDRLKIKHAEILNAEGRDYLERMQNAASRMQTLISDLLALSRVANHPQPFVNVDLANVAQTVVSDLEVRLLRTGAKVEIGPLPTVVADRGQMTQLLQNLIGNGIKFRKPGEPPVVKVSGALRNNAMGDGDTCEITVEDHGIGFDEKYADRIFRVFQRLHGRSEYEGTGIGLAICRKIVERHGGRIIATSKPGMGAKFIVTLPDRQISKDPQYE